MIHLLRPCVGIDSIEQLARWQQSDRHIVTEDGSSVAYFPTRRIPVRINELTDGGSVYWIIKNTLQLRQRIVDVVERKDDEGQRYCLFLLDTELVRIESRPQRAIRGWRYLDPAKAPADIGPYSLGDNEEEPPEDMAMELRESGLL